MTKVEIKGKENLDAKQTSALNEIIKHYEGKLERISGDASSIEVRIKKYSKEGKAHEYSINVKVILKERKFESNSSEWEFNASIRECFEKILIQIQHESKG